MVTKEVTIFSVTIRTIERGSRYEGSINELAPGRDMTFEIDVSLSDLRALDKLSWSLLSSPTPALLFKRTSHPPKMIVDGEPIDILSGEETYRVFFGPILLAIGMLGDFNTDESLDEGTFRVPCISDENHNQFPDADSLQEFIQTLNE